MIPISELKTQRDCDRRRLAIETGLIIVKTMNWDCLQNGSFPDMLTEKIEVALKEWEAKR